MARTQRVKDVIFTARVELMGLPEARAALRRFPEVLVRRWVMKGVRKAASATAKRYRQQLRKHKRTGQLGRAAGYVARVYRRGAVLFCVVGARRGLWAELPDGTKVRPTTYQHLLEGGRKAVRPGTGRKQAKALAFTVTKRLRTLRAFAADSRVNTGKATALTKMTTGRGKGRSTAWKRGKSAAAVKGWRVFSTRAAAVPGFGLLKSNVDAFRDALLTHVPAAIRAGCDAADTRPVTGSGVESGGAD